jgi:hypothetical protein
LISGAVNIKWESNSTNLDGKIDYNLRIFKVISVQFEVRYAWEFVSGM